MELLEKQLKALANSRRLGILRFLEQVGKASVSDISREIKLSFKATSKHLIILRAGELVESEQQSLMVFYSLHNPKPPLLKQFLTSWVA